MNFLREISAMKISNFDYSNKMQLDPRLRQQSKRPKKDQDTDLENQNEMEYIKPYKYENVQSTSAGRSYGAYQYPISEPKISDFGQFHQNLQKNEIL